MNGDPSEALREDRARAAAAADPNASLCVLATVDADGGPQARVLVLREVDGRMAIFLNATSPKARQLDLSETVCAVVWLPSLGVQYRIDCRLERIPHAMVSESWQLRPLAAKRLDWLYERQSQGTPVADRESLLAALDAIEPTAAPPDATGFWLEPTRVDRLRLDDSGVHERCLYEREANAWTRRVLVP